MTISDRANSIENQLPEENPSNDMPQEVVIIITISHNVFVNACLEAWAQRANLSARRLEWDIGTILDFSVKIIDFDTYITVI